VLANPWLRVGSGAEMSINAHGNLLQPWYFSDTWYKLTYSNYPLDMAVGLGNTATSHWTASTVYDLYALGPRDATTDWTGFIPVSSAGGVSTGYGVVVSARTFSIGDSVIRIVNRYTLTATGRFIRIQTEATNLGSATAYNMRVWAGTRDDWVGYSDSPRKTRATLSNTSVVPLTASTQAASALLIESGVEAVLFYSAFPGVNSVWNRCCSFANAYNQDPNANAVVSPYEDGSYAAVFYLGDMAPAATQTLTWYYAAGPRDILVSTVVAAVANQTAGEAFSPLPTPTNTRTLSPGASNSATITASGSGTASGTAAATATSSATSSASSTAASTGTSSATSTATGSTSLSASGTVTPTGTGTASGTATLTGTGTASGTSTAAPTVSSTASGTATRSSSRPMTRWRRGAPAPAPPPPARTWRSA
jgi:hypothetical protein